MLTGFITFLVLLTIITVMSVGIFFGKKPISGSCGGLANLHPEGNVNYAVATLQNVLSFQLIQ